jgi:phage terminase large subunit
MGGHINIIDNIERRFLPQQLEIFEATKKFRYILYSGAVRAGKTLLAAHVAIITCIKNPGCQGFIGSLTTPQLTDVVFKVFQQELKYYQDVLDKNNIPIQLARMKFSKGDMKAIFWNGSEVMFKSCDKEEKIRGYTLDFAILDEPIEIDETIYKQLIQRISGGHLENTFLLLTTNPGSQSHWIYQNFFVNATEEHYTVETTTYDNVLLPQYVKFIKSTEQNLDEDWILRFLNGKWGAYAGQIYKNFNPEKHVGNYKNFKAYKYTVCGVDWGHRHATCILAIAITEDKDIIVLKEHFEKGMTTPQVAEKIKDFHNDFHFKKVYIDASKPDLIVQASDLGVPAIKSERDVDGRIGKIKGLLKNNKLHIDALCRNLIAQMQAYRYKKNTEKPVEEDDDAPDALGYGLTGFRSFKKHSLVGYAKRNLWDF